jgi:cell wall-associated NlpC family hydrolase
LAAAALVEAPTATVQVAPLTRREARAREQAAQAIPAQAIPEVSDVAPSEPVVLIATRLIDTAPQPVVSEPVAAESAAPFVAEQTTEVPQTPRAPRPEQSSAPRAPHSHSRAHTTARKAKPTRSSRPSRLSAFARPRTAAAASAASLGLIASLLFAIPANAAEPGGPAAALPSVRDSHGQTAAQILQVANDASIPQAARDSYVATALSTIAAEEAAKNAATATQIVDGVPNATGGDNPTTPAQIQTAIADALQVGGARQQIVETALSYLGDPYLFGGTTHAGIDCSGLVMAAYAPVGITFSTHLVGAEDAAGTTIPESEAQPGDLLVFNDDDHIGIYLGSGLVIHAPDVGRPVEIEAAWDSDLAHYVRVLPN